MLSVSSAIRSYYGNNSFRCYCPVPASFGHKQNISTNRAETQIVFQPIYVQQLFGSFCISQMSQKVVNVDIENSVSGT